MPTLPDELGKLIQEVTLCFCKSSSWSEFIRQERGPSELQPNLHLKLQHPAAPLLHRLSKHGVPLLRHSKPWSQERRNAAMQRGSHQSAHQHYHFLREEMANMIKQKHWIILPYKYVHILPYLCISPMGVVPQRDRRSRTIVDYSFSGLNQDTMALSPFEAMQFGHSLDRILQRIHFANRKYGPVFLIKIDISDGFYRLRLADGSIPSFGVAFPTLPGEEQLVAFPLVLPMGWVASPPYFCALTETIADISNEALHRGVYPLQDHRLQHMADHPINEKPVSRRPPASATPATFTIATPATTSLGFAAAKHAPLSAHSAAPGQTAMPSPPRSPILASPPKHTQPNQLHVPTRPLAYVDLYMDDFLGLAQGHPKLRNKIRSTILHSIDMVFCPNDERDQHTLRRDPISHSKLHKGDARWTTRKVILGWILDTVSETVELPEHRYDRLISLLSQLSRTRRISLRAWQKALGELRSMVLALPGGRGLFCTLYTGLTQPQTAATHRIRLTRPIQDAIVWEQSWERGWGGP
jgi:hypothetical protein